MILLDTHIWIWWVHGAKELKPDYESIILNNENHGLGVSIISCWEVAKLVENKRLKLPIDISNWIDTALNYPGIVLIPITPEIAVESTQLPGSFHKDPADQIIVATSRIFNIPILTVDKKIIDYQFVEKA
ncbi:MAG: type II toxin-antitoxin system VapC family toxin [Candidatus Kapabacteria bacterium]|nr:type II toxin-antitoxin system VapC family toxin [Candidatus Kapabacteria bacterium]